MRGRRLGVVANTVLVCFGVGLFVFFSDSFFSASGHSENPFRSINCFFSTALLRPCEKQERKQNKNSAMKVGTLTGVTAALMASAFAPCLGSVQFTPHKPSLVAATSQPEEYVYFPQTLRQVGASLLISYQSDSDALHDDGWTGGLVGSKDAGSTWVAVAQPLSNHLVKSCIADPSSGSAGANSTFCLEYATRKVSPNSTINTQATLGAHVYAVPPVGAGSDAPFVQVSVRQSTINFPAAHAPKSWGPNTFLMVADGKIHTLKSGGLLLLLYGTYDTDSAYSIVAVKSVDGGASWNWLSTVSHGAPAPCDKPSEHDCTYLADGSLYCVWRSDGGACVC